MTQPHDEQQPTAPQPTQPAYPPPADPFASATVTPPTTPQPAVPLPPEAEPTPAQPTAAQPTPATLPIAQDAPASPVSGAPAPVSGTPAPAFPTPPPTAAYPTVPQPGYPVSGQPAYPTSGQPAYPAQPGYPTSGQPAYPVSGQPGYPVSGQPAYPGMTYPGVPGAPAKKSKAPLIIGIVLGLLLLLCGGGIGAYVLLTRNTEGTGATSAKDATQSFLTAVYKSGGNAAAAEKLVCGEARDRKEIEAKIAEIKSQTAQLKGPNFTWESPKISGETATQATAEVTIKLVTSDEKMSEQKLTLTLVKHEGWFVCEVK
ncbi:Rv0361 family membrane protein [Catellatospora citrea]|uniref:Ig-like domain-containing protein n=1 Tax=Catellatospora citrea TaxID=53366 RepID=A0A8J3KMQ7_9ACTN|nr:hypothetical protein [Catellatospora citrea]RKE08686.1 hypothetical protein C8E86_3543 [Catellatospora citrea]GIG01514.1 hypothetical protein Cci01nite_66070 [Catellatospora citrea]